MKKKILVFMLSCVPAVVFAADEVLVKQGDTVITRRDVQLAVENFVPEQGRAEVLASEKRLRDFVAQLFAVRKLADEARSRELNADERWKIDASAERAAAQVQLDHLVDRRQVSDFTAAAREFYLANPKQFIQPEQVHAQHVLVKTEGRTRDEALALAKLVLALAQKGDQDFGKLAEEFTEDPTGKGSGGDLGFFGRGRMVKPFEDAVFGMKAVGELTGPVESPFGFHVIRLIERKAETTIPFDEVKDKLVRDETLKYRRMAIGQQYERIGKLPGIEVDQDAIKALVKPIDFKAHAHAAEK